MRGDEGRGGERRREERRGEERRGEERREESSLAPVDAKHTSLAPVDASAETQNVRSPTSSKSFLIHTTIFLI